jgi:hypothetical protein
MNSEDFVIAECAIDLYLIVGDLHIVVQARCQMTTSISCCGSSLPMLPVGHPPQ